MRLILLPEALDALGKAPDDGRSENECGGCSGEDEVTAVLAEGRVDQCEVAVVGGGPVPVAGGGVDAGGDLAPRGVAFRPRTAQVQALGGQASNRGGPVDAAGSTWGGVVKAHLLIVGCGAPACIHSPQAGAGGVLRGRLWSPAPASAAVGAGRGRIRLGPFPSSRAFLRESDDAVVGLAPKCRSRTEMPDSWWGSADARRRERSGRPRRVRGDGSAARARRRQGRRRA